MRKLERAMENEQKAKENVLLSEQKVWRNKEDERMMILYYRLVDCIRN